MNLARRADGAPGLKGHGGGRGGPEGGTDRRALRGGRALEETKLDHGQDSRKIGEQVYLLSNTLIASKLPGRRVRLLVLTILP